MAAVYLLYSQKLDRFYIGSCKDLTYRINQHLNKEFVKSFTAKVSDWELFYSMDELEYKQARLIEAHLKRMRSRKYYEDLKKYPEIMIKLKAKCN